MAKKIHRTKLHQAFAYLEAKGFVAPRKAFWCCTSCGCAALPEGTKKFVFYHEQDYEHFTVGGDGMMLCFGETVEEGNEIVAALKHFNVPVEWNSDITTKIHIYPR